MYEMIKCAHCSHDALLAWPWLLGGYRGYICSNCKLAAYSKTVELFLGECVVEEADRMLPFCPMPNDVMCWHNDVLIYVPKMERVTKIDPNSN